MKLVTAIIQPQQLPAVKRALFEADIKHMTCTNVLGTASEGVDVLVFRGVPHEVTLQQKVRVELALRDELKDQAVDAIKRGAAGSGGFGVIMVSELDEFINVGSGASSESALG